MNGLNMLDFDGNQSMQASLAIPADGNIAFHAVFDIDASSNEFAAILAVDAANDFQIDAGHPSQFNGRLNAVGIGSSTALTGGPFSGSMIMSAVFDRTGSGTAEIFMSNTQRCSMTYTTPIDPAAALHLMANRSINARIDGGVAELIVTGDVSNRAQHHSYLANKWGVS